MSGEFLSHYSFDILNKFLILILMLYNLNLARMMEEKYLWSCFNLFSKIEHFPGN